ncbi:MAG: hypothetical protein NKF70_02395 [Methanobacterium sp. ERen5]|nr:MAG: hypothetical protein NKF70_02395 [Methanobacterium sp. ERen5]
MKINKIVILSIFAISMLCSLAASTAYVNMGSNSVTVTNDGDNSSNGYAQLSVDGIIYPMDGKLPKNYGKYKNSTFQVSKYKSVKYRPSVRSQGLLTNITGIKFKNSYINFGDGTKTSYNGWIAHTYNRSGWYKILVSFNATFANASCMGQKFNGTIVGATKEYLVYVSTKPQLSLGQVTCGYTSIRNYKNRNVNYLDVKVTNTGSASSKATQIKIWYEQPHKVGSVYNRLKSYTKSASLKPLKPGQTTTVRVYFSMPKKYSILWKDIQLDSPHKLNQFDRSATLYRLK